MLQETTSPPPRVDHAGTSAPLSPELMAFVLRVGLGLVILIGGMSKLLQALNPDRAAGFVESYMSPAGYVNEFFATYLFEGAMGAVLTPLSFLTALSVFEFVCGALLIAGLFVRPLSLIWGLLFWTFVLALPVVTAAGYDITIPTHESPALLVLIRDIGLSGLFFVLFGIGAGAWSLDEKLVGPAATRRRLPWDSLGLLLRLSLALPLLVGGAFAGHGSHIQTFGIHPVLLLVVGGLLVANIGVRLAGGLLVGMMIWHFIGVFDMGRPLIGDLNAFKREFAVLAGAAILIANGGGGAFSVLRIRSVWNSLMRPGDPGAGVHSPAPSA